MRPKEFYEKFTFQEENNYVFCLFPSDLKDDYILHIKNPISAIETDLGNVQCQSYLDFKNGDSVMNEIWKGIQKANVVIADITGFNPNVMYELGVALMKKERVLIIANKKENQKRQQNLPYNLAHTKIELYDDFDKLTEFITDQIKKSIVGIEKEKIKDAQALKLMKDAKDLINAKKAETSLYLFKEMDHLEPENWYIFKEWAGALSLLKNYEEANERYRKSLEYADSDRQRALIYINMAEMFRFSKQTNQALVAFEKAVNLDPDDADLYEKWAYLYYTMGEYQQAMNKMVMAVRLKQNKENQHKLEYYTKRFADNSFIQTLQKWLKSKTEIANPPQRPNHRSNHRHDQRRDPRNDQRHDQRRHQSRQEQRSSSPRYNQSRQFKNFESRHGVGDIITGTIENIKFANGIFVALSNGLNGLIHKSNLPRNFDMNNEFPIGGKIKVRIAKYRYNTHQVDLELA